MTGGGGTHRVLNTIQTHYTVYLLELSISVSIKAIRTLWVQQRYEGKHVISYLHVTKNINIKVSYSMYCAFLKIIFIR